MDQELRAAQVTLGHRLRDLRKGAGLTQQQLGAATLTSRSSIACIEAGRQNPDHTFWPRADKATGSDGVLVAPYCLQDSLQANVRSTRRYGLMAILARMAPMCLARRPAASLTYPRPRR
jgi:transcriptional regulator with XRE-family HTH domain